MFSSSLSWIFSVVFLVTGIYSLVRLTEMYTGPDHTGSRFVEMSHLLMSIAMIAMSWAWSGDASTPSGLVQIVVFGLFTLWFLIRLVRPGDGHSRVGGAYHLVMNVAMIWMVAAMPLIMGMDMSAPGMSATGMSATGMSATGMSATGMSATGGAEGAASSTPVWVGAVTWLFVVLLVAGAVLWTVRAVRRAPADPEATSRVSAGPAVAADGGTVALAAPATTRACTTGARLDVSCHLLMSLGMTGMLLAML